MKAHERREIGAYPYFKIDAWDARIGAYRPVRGAYATQAEAVAACQKPGRYRVAQISRGTDWHR
jgi:hypothetical protein